jgi:hypothetical protein
MVGLLIVGRQLVGAVVRWVEDPRRRIRWQGKTAILALGSGSAAKVEGVVTPVGKPLVSPLLKRECVAWRVCGRRARGDRQYEAWDACDFVIEDGTGSALVPRDNLELVLPPAEFASRAHDAIGPDDVLFDERVLEVGARAVVSGPTVLAPDPTGARDGVDYREAPRRPVFDASAGQPIRAFPV